MKFKYILIGLAIVTSLVGYQITNLQIPIWTGSHYVWIRLGPTLVVQNGTLDVLPGPPLPKRTFNLVLSRNQDGTYTIPSGATNIVVYQGIRYSPGFEYEIKGNLIVPLIPTWPNWGSDGPRVIIDYDL